MELKNLSILYVEDDAETRRQFAHMLGKIVGTVYVASDGQQGVEIFSGKQPDLVVSDIMMPVMDGLEMTAKIREQNPETPIILTTAFNETRYLLRAIELGIDNYVLKPVEFQLLHRAISQCAAILFNKRELASKNAQLELYHAAAEDERSLVAHLMKRMMQADGLRDEALRYWLQPSDVVSGDLIAAARARSGKLFTMVADSTGHGLPAALNLLPLNRIFYRMVEKGFSLGTMIDEMNMAIRAQSPSDRFVAASLVSVDPAARIVEYWNGGNPAIRFVDNNGDVIKAFASANLPLGVIDKTFVAHPGVFCWDQPGWLLMFSDGLMDAEDGEGNPFEADRLLQAIRGVAPENWITAIREALALHLGPRTAHDDVSLAIVDCTK